MGSSKITSHDIDETIATTELVEQKISEIPTPDVSGQINDHNTDGTAHGDTFYTKTQVDNLIASIPKITYGTTDLSAGVSELSNGTIYIVHE